MRSPAKNILSFLSVISLLLSPVFLSFTLSGKELPVTNKKIIEYCELNMGKKIDRGECWDLLKYALDFAKADWSAPLDFGEKINYKVQDILPGDIVQFKNAKFVYENGSNMNMPHHFAIVYKVNGSGQYTLVHQNVNGYRKLRRDDIDLNFLKKGKITFFRPQSR